MSRATNWKMSPFDHRVPPERFLGSAAIFVWPPTSALVSLSNPRMDFCSQAFSKSSLNYLRLSVQQDAYMLSWDRRQCPVVAVVLLEGIVTGGGVDASHRLIGVTGLSRASKHTALVWVALLHASDHLRLRISPWQYLSACVSIAFASKPMSKQQCFSLLLNPFGHVSSTVTFPCNNIFVQRFSISLHFH
jgi:hypothetical protein